jgi:hypothetical protein
LWDIKKGGELNLLGSNLDISCHNSLRSFYRFALWEEEEVFAGISALIYHIPQQIKLQ